MFDNKNEKQFFVLKNIRKVLLENKNNFFVLKNIK